MYWKSIVDTNCSGVRSAASFQTGFFSDLAQRSQIALTTAPRARWVTPFCGPSQRSWLSWARARQNAAKSFVMPARLRPTTIRSEEHTSELQSRLHLVCRLLLEKKKKKK